MRHTFKKHPSFVGSRFKKEFKKQLRTLILITLGFTIAFTWRQTIFDLSQSFVQLFIKTNGSSLLSISTSIFITVISVLLVYLSARLFQDNSNNNY